MTKANILPIVVTAVLLFGAAGAALANHTWGKYHWDLSTAETEINPLQLHDNLTTAAWKTSLTQASADWNLSVIKNAVTPGSKNPTTCDPTIGSVEVCNAEYGQNGWLGIAQIWAYRGKDGHIAQAVTMLNDTYFAMPFYDSQAWRDFVMCQEVGHTFGLGHQDENFGNTNLGTCMDYTSDPAGTLGTNGILSNEHPNAHDYEILESIYAHLNGTDTGSGGGGKPDKEDGGGGNGKNKSETNLDPASWGQAIAQDAQGKDSVYVRNLENGMVQITHVLWTLEEEHDHDEHTH